MLAAYYSKGCDSRGLFAGKKAEKAESFNDYLNQKNVIRLDIQRFLESDRDLDSFIFEIQRAVKEAIIGMISHVRCKIDPSTCQNDMTTFKTKDDVLTLLIHLGYLSFDERNSEAFIPNQEIAQEFLRAVKTGGWDGVVQALQRSDRLLQNTWEMDGSAVAEGVAAIHNETASVLKYNNENSLTCTVFMAYYSAKACYMNPILELPSEKGFADVVYLPKRDVDKPALVVELKWNQSAAGAIEQIKDRQYASWIEGYTGEMLLVGICYDVRKGHKCVIERYVKADACEQ